MLPGRAGGFSLIAARADTVYWWNNVTRALYRDTALTDEDSATVIAGNFYNAPGSVLVLLSRVVYQIL